MAAPIIAGILLTEAAVVALEATLAVAVGIVGAASVGEKIKQIENAKSGFSDSVPSAVQSCAFNNKISEIDKKIKNADAGIKELEKLDDEIKEFEKNEDEMSKEIKEIEDAISRETDYKTKDSMREEIARINQSRRRNGEELIKKRGEVRKVEKEYGTESINKLKQTRKELELERQKELANLNKAKTKKIENRQEVKSRSDKKQLDNEKKSDSPRSENDEPNLHEISRGPNGEIILKPINKR